MQMRAGFGVLLLAVVIAAPASAIVVIEKPVRPAAACFSAAPGCDAGAEATTATAQANDVPAPLVAGIVGVLALGLAFVRRPRGLQEVVC